MQPRFATQASAAALSTIANTVECPLGNCTNTSSTYSGWFAGTRFWWKKSASTPFGKRFMWNGRRRRWGRASSATPT